MIYILISAVIILIGLMIWVVVTIRNLTSPAIIFRNPAKGPALPGLTRRVLESGRMQRGYLLYVPGSYDPARPMPLVISLHGFASNPAGQKYLSGWETLAEKENFLVVYPQGTSSPLRWNASADLSTGQVDDVAFMRDLLANLRQLLNIDQSRIYINGMSNSGAMTTRLVCEMADVFAAVGIVSGPPVNIPGGCHPARPVPLIAFYGTADPLVKYNGGTIDSSPATRLLRLPTHRGSLPPVKSWIEAWAQRNGCNLTPQILPGRGETSGVRYTGCQQEAEVVFYTIDGGGHTWPGGSPTFVGKTSHSIDATSEMWGFFKTHAMTGQ
jgi:polyhydroxybutyrate depolymerase